MTPSSPLPKPPSVPGPFEYRCTRTSANIRLCRQVLANWLELLPGVDVDAMDDLLVVCSELVTNAVLHAPEGPDTIRLRARADGDAVVLEVEDQGDGFAWPVTHAMSDVEDSDEHGRGLFIVEALTDRLGVVPAEDGGDGAVVRCVKFGVLHHTPVASEAVVDLSTRFRDQRQSTH